MTMYLAVVLALGLATGMRLVFLVEQVSAPLIAEGAELVALMFAHTVVRMSFRTFCRMIVLEVAVLATATEFEDGKLARLSARVAVRALMLQRFASTKRTVAKAETTLAIT